MDGVIKVGAGAVVVQDGKVLLAKRKGRSAGMWGSMGGHVEPGETPAQAAKREAMEELGIEIGDLRFAVCASLTKDDAQVIDISFTAKIISGEPRICEPDKVEEIGWFPLDALPEPLFEPVWTVLEAERTGQRYFEIKK